MQDTDKYTKFISKVIGEYNRYLRDFKGVYPSDLMHLSTKEDGVMSMGIIDPCVDPTYEYVEIDPTKEYGEKYLTSDFVNSDLVKSLVEWLGYFVDEDYRNRPVE